MRKKLGELLIAAGAITQEDLEKAVEYQKKKGLRLGEALIDLGVISEEEMATALGKQLNIPYYTFDKLTPRKDQA